MKGRGANEKLDWIDNFDPRILGLAAQKGVIFRFVPPVGIPELLLKEDNGFSTNWAGLQIQSSSVYFVGPNQKFTTIQSAIDQAFADGSGVPGNAKTIYIAPGSYSENLVFRPGQALVAMSANVAIGAVTIGGQHVYTTPATGDLLTNTVALQGLTFFDGAAGSTLLFDVSVGEGFFSIAGCTLLKDSLTGNAIRGIGSNGVLVMLQTNSANHQSTDSFIYSENGVLSVGQSSFQNGAAAGFIDYAGSGTCIITQNTTLASGTYVMSMTSGNAFMQGNFFNVFGTDADGIRVGATASVLFTNSTLNVPAGLGYVFQGTGTVNGAMIVYGGGNSTKDPGLTFNLLPSDPP